MEEKILRNEENGRWSIDGVTVFYIQDIVEKIEISYEDVFKHIQKLIVGDRFIEEVHFYEMADAYIEFLFDPYTNNAHILFPLEGQSITYFITEKGIFDLIMSLGGEYVKKLSDPKTFYEKDKERGILVFNNSTSVIGSW